MRTREVGGSLSLSDTNGVFHCCQRGAAEAATGTGGSSKKGGKGGRQHRGGGAREAQASRGRSQDGHNPTSARPQTEARGRPSPRARETADHRRQAGPGRAGWRYGLGGNSWLLRVIVDKVPSGGTLWEISEMGLSGQWLRESCQPSPGAAKSSAPARADLCAREGAHRPPSLSLCVYIYIYIYIYKVNLPQ